MSRMWKADTSYVSESDYRATLGEEPEEWTETVTLTRTIEVSVICNRGSTKSSDGLSYRTETNGRRAHGLKMDGSGAGEYTRLNGGEVEQAMIKAKEKHASEAYWKWQRLYKETTENFDAAPAIEIDGDGVYKTPCLVCNELFEGLDMDYLQTKVRITDDGKSYDHTVRGLVCSTCDTDEYLKEVVEDIGLRKGGE